METTGKIFAEYNVAIFFYNPYYVGAQLRQELYVSRLITIFQLPSLLQVLHTFPSFFGKHISLLAKF